MTALPTIPISRRGALAATVSLALGGCTIRGKTPTPLAVSGDRSYPAATRPNLLISTNQLVERLRTNPDNLRLLDARPLRDYRAGHVQSARHVWWQDTMERNALSYGATLKPDDETGAQTRRQAVLNLWDVDPSQVIVVYDDLVSIEAARIVWFLLFMGFPSSSVLDGGYAGWLARDIDISAHPGSQRDGVASLAQPQAGYYLLYEQVVNRLAEGNTILLDVRTDAELRDTVDGTVRPGTIPGAISWPWTDLLDSGQRIRAGAELTERARTLGLLPSQRVVLVGRFATDCALTWLALQLIGFRDVPTYDGGWMEWSTRADAPVVWL